MTMMSLLTTFITISTIIITKSIFIQAIRRDPSSSFFNRDEIQRNILTSITTQNNINNDSFLLRQEQDSKRRDSTTTLHPEVKDTTHHEQHPITTFRFLDPLTCNPYFTDLPTPQDHLVTSLPYLPPNLFKTKHYAGHLPASPNNNHQNDKLFYWFFEPDLTSHKDLNLKDIPLLIWLNGGPGCSSMDGLWLENGPFRLVQINNNSQNDNEDDWIIDLNPYSWHTAPAYVLYIDQPVGTGLSFSKNGKYAKNDEEVNQGFYYFLQMFLWVYRDTFLSTTTTTNNNNNENSNDGCPQYVMNRSLYFSGESHAGHYIPSMMDYILSRNDDTKTKPSIIIPLGGGAIGNGWIDPYYQYSASGVAYGTGLIDLSQKEYLDTLEVTCQQKLKKKSYEESVCFSLLNNVVNQSSGKYGDHIVSMYDNRSWEQRGGDRTFPPGHRDVERYLGGWTGKDYPSSMKVNYQTVLSAIHASESVDAKQRYEECTDPPYYALAYQDGKGVVNEVVRILEHPTNPRLLFFNGMNDMICNHVGNEKLLDALQWSHSKDWIIAQRYAWKANNKNNNNNGNSNGSPDGYLKEYKNLSFLKLLNSGHMVPMDIPDVALSMISTFLYDASFQSSLQVLSSAIPRENDGDCPSCSATCHENSIQDSTNNYGSSDGVGSGGDDDFGNKMDVSSSFWIGAVLGVGVFVCAIVTYFNKRRHRRVRLPIQDDTFDLELEQEHTIS